MEDNERDFITIEDENGQEREFAVEALFEMEDDYYTLLSSSDGEPILMKIKGEEGNQELIGISDPNERDNILSAYEIAVEANPAKIT
ncbi:DUF1292 domain-containing protein [Cytobacillus sp. S13-E01]|uniref:DUF1292 domain-containing protein n=1 Tax=Cytobacillus sp. S13-E01 TaxID=3031326 RepID=UPI0023D81261|nr:DUF1292 domain-containing protein [Cytobacillus sp. S13-E01]MDF0725647.1 DUF1292 domain-containing protein [Cytobacillus sp. S13-E01]